MTRQIRPEMVAWLDERLKDNPVAQDALERKHARALLLEAARACVGVRERGGNNRGPIVELMQQTIGKAEGEAWCASFVQTLIAYCELKTGQKSRVFASEHCATIWNNTHTELRVKKHPAPGAIVIWGYQGTISGHCGIVLDAGSAEFRAIEGNTEAGLSPSEKVERDGGGVYLTRRNRLGQGRMIVRGFLKPF